MFYIINDTLVTGTIDVEKNLSGWRFATGTAAMWSFTGTVMDIRVPNHYVSGVMWSGNTGSITDPNIIANPIHVEFSPYVCSTFEHDYSVMEGTASREEVIQSDPDPFERGVVQHHTMKKYSALKSKYIKSYATENDGMAAGIAATANWIYSVGYYDTGKVIQVSRSPSRTATWYGEHWYYFKLLVEIPAELSYGVLEHGELKFALINDSVGFVVCDTGPFGGPDVIQLIKFDMTKPLDIYGNHYKIVATIPETNFTYDGREYAFAGRIFWMVNSKTFVDRSPERNMLVFPVLCSSEVGDDRDVIRFYMYDVELEQLSVQVMPLSDDSSHHLIASSYDPQPCIDSSGWVWCVIPCAEGIPIGEAATLCVCPVFYIDRTGVRGVYNYKYDQEFYNQSVVGSACMYGGNKFCFSLVNDTVAEEDKRQFILIVWNYQIEELASRNTIVEYVRLLDGGLTDGCVFVIDPPMTAATGNIRYISHPWAADWSVFWNFPKFDPAVTGDDLAKYIFVDIQNKRVWGLWNDELIGKPYKGLSDNKTITIDWGGSFPVPPAGYDEVRTCPFIACVSGNVIVGLGYSDSANPPHRYYRIYSLYPDYPGSDFGEK